jgi:hypothetical protein
LGPGAGLQLSSARPPCWPCRRLQASLRSLPPRFGVVFDKGNEAAAEEKLRDLATSYSQQLKDRAAAELLSLSFTT